MLQTFLQTFRKDTLNKLDIICFKFDIGASFHPESGYYEKKHQDCLADFFFYRVTQGDRLECHNPLYQFQLAGYTEETEQRLIYTYCYQEEENWTTYRRNFHPEGWKTCGCEKNGYEIEFDGWVRIAVRRQDGSRVTEADREAATKAFILYRKREEYREKPYFTDEIKRTAETVMKKRKEDSLIFGLMTDSHYVINGGWEDSIFNMEAVHKRVKFDGVVHLGDLTDGMVPLEVTREYVKRCKDDLNRFGTPVYLALGNHDSNYFNRNPEWMTREQQSKFYLEKPAPWYLVDFAKQKLRCLFLFSFDHRETIRYGFPDEEVEWVREKLQETPEGYSVLIFSHVPLLPEMHFWSDQIRNSDTMKRVLDEHIDSGGLILGYIHGHNHADQIFYTDHFPIVSVGCAKCEDFKDKKPEGATTYNREKGTVSQELWDVMVVDAAEKKIDFIRFGAGEDRCIGIRG